MQKGLTVNQAVMSLSSSLRRSRSSGNFPTAERSRSIAGYFGVNSARVSFLQTANSVCSATILSIKSNIRRFASITRLARSDSPRRVSSSAKLPLIR